MSDSLMMIIGIFVAIILMFVFPLMQIAGESDELSQTVVQVAVSDFVNTVANQGKITEFDYNELVQKLTATNNAYEIEIEAQILDDNPRRVTTTGNNELVGEYKYYSVYTSTILDKVTTTSEYILKKDDYIIATVKNTNITLGTQLKNFLYRLIGRESYTIGTSASGLVAINGEDNIEISGMTENEIKYPDKEITVKTKVRKEEIISTDEDEFSTIVILDCESTTMPFHNEQGDSETFIQNIINGLDGSGSLGFILTSSPSTVYGSDSISWIYNATVNNASENYCTAINTALGWLESKEEKKCIVFLSWRPDQSYLKDAINVLTSNLDRFDWFYTTYCCTDYYSSAQWYSAIESEKLRGTLGSGDEETRFERVSSTVKVTWIEQPPVSENVVDFKIKLTNVDHSGQASIKINGTEYIIGINIPSYVMYNDTTKDEYILDLKLVVELLGMTTEEWLNSEVELSYSQTSE